MENTQARKLEMVTPETLIVGVDIAKKVQWARFCDYRGLELSKALRFHNNMEGFRSISEMIKTIQTEKGLVEVIVGMEPTGHYWKPLANFLNKEKIKVVMVNPYHTKRAKELDDNSQTKSDTKDAIVIARLIKDGRYSEVYIPTGIYAELRVLSNTRIEIQRMQNATKNRIRAVMDEYFPEFETVFKSFLKAKSAIHMMKTHPFPEDVLRLGEEGIVGEFRKVTKKTVGKKKATALLKAAKESIGIDYGTTAAKMRLGVILDEHELLEGKLIEIEEQMEWHLKASGYAESLLSMQGLGIVTAASVLGEIGDPKRFQNAQQIIRLAGLNLTENSSGQSKSKTGISKRGRKNLRAILYRIALVMTATNAEMKQLYGYLKDRKENPLRKKQAIIVIACKVVKIMFALMKKKEKYSKLLVLGEHRQRQIDQVA